MTALIRNNVQIAGPDDGPVLMFSHGFGTDQNMWGRILPYFTEKYRVVLFDHVGSGGSDKGAYDSGTYSSIGPYVMDLLEICDELDLRDVTLVGHSVGAMMAVEAACKDGGARLNRLVLLTASPSYLDHPEDGYIGGFTRHELDDLFVSLEANYLVWANSMAPVFMNNPASPELGTEIQGSFGRIKPMVGRDFARVAFLSDVRHLLGSVDVPALILQTTDDVVTPPHIGAYLLEKLPHGTLVTLAAKGHFPQASAPEETAGAILDYLQGPL
ncbi:alpha/beta fold hydrolase [Arthrobacter oryzae]|uniref:alpha/beta fold hydrolase n=1 Tax=Arthrobacter oryzae TaxID=409290 RepID=UPI00160571D3|nr:alpha/beta hydrolase [Arthrobacter oryzae]